MKTVFLSFSILFFLNTFSQTTYVPDDNFENYLETHDAAGNVVPVGDSNSMGNGIANDDYVFTNRINTVTNLVIASKGISDLTGIEAFSALTNLDCSGNTIGSLDVSSNTNLVTLNCSGSTGTLGFTPNISSLTLGNITSLQTLDCSYNTLSSLNVSNQTGLINLNCNYNTIGTLDVSSNTSLEVLNCKGSPGGFLGTGITSNISSLSLGSITSLKTIDCSFNPTLISLNVSNQTGLINLNCNYNTLGTLDVSNNTQLETLYCNGLYKESGTFGSTTVTITPNISSLQLGTISSIKTLECTDNLLTSLSLSNLTALEVLDCSNNSLGTLDVSNNTALTKLTCKGYYDGLVNMYTYYPNISTLNLGSISSLVELDCTANNLSSIDVSNQSSLKFLYVRANNLTTLDVSSNTALEILNCKPKQKSNPTKISYLNLGTITTLKEVYCSSNALTTLDLSKNTGLTKVNCDKNDLRFLNVKNANNNLITEFDASVNPNIQCLQVDDATAANTGTGVYASWIKDAGVSYGENCMTYVPDDIFEAYLETHDANGNIVAVGSSTSMGNGISNDNYVTTANINTITNLDVSGLGISNLTGIEDFTALTNLNCSGNGSLTTIDISQNTALTYLNVTGCALSSLDVSQNTALNSLYSNSNQLTTLDVSQNTNLIYLDCNGNNLTSLNLGQNTVLLELHCGSNQLTVLDVSQNTNLRDLSCFGNQLTSLDVSQNSALDSLLCWDNQLTSLNVKNGNNTNITNANFNATNNSNLSCIQVDDPAWSSTNWTNIDSQSFFATNCAMTYVPDNNFENYLETHDAAGNLVSLGDPNSMGNGIVNDDYVLTSRINTITNLDVSLVGILDLTGIEDFTALTNLDCSGNNGLSIDISQNTALTILQVFACNISNIDISANTLLEVLDCGANNNLSNLNLTQNTALKYLYCDYSNLTSLNLSQNTSLIELSVIDNNLTNLDLTQNINLQTLKCQLNNLTSINLNQNTNLSYLDISQNQITYLDVSQNTALYRLYCYDNQLTSLSVYHNNNLQSLFCSNNQITNLILPNVKTNLFEVGTSTNQLTSLDISDYPNVNFIVCNNNQLQQLNVKNGNNTNIPNVNFNATNNPNLSCIEVDNASWSTSNWTNIDATASFNNNCNFNQTNVPDDNFEAYLETHDANGNVVSVGDPNSMGNGIFNDNYVLTSRINTVANLNISGLNISDLTGIEDFTALQILNCSNNNITFLITDQNTSLVELDCSYNQLTSLGVTPTTIQKVTCNNNNLNDLVINPATLKYLYCQNNNLQVLDLQNMYNLIEVNCNANQINNLDLINSGANLTILRCEDNLLTGINTDANINLSILECGFNNISSVNLTTNALLKELDVYNNNLTSLDLTQNTQLELLDCSSNNLSSLNLNQNTQLNDLDFSDNQISSIDLTLNILLQRIISDSNQLSQLDVSQNNQLVLFTCNNNPSLTNISMANGNNINITVFRANNNPYLACIEVDDISIPNSPVWQKDDNASYSENCTLKTKIWETGQWTNGAPTINDIAIIRDNYYTSFAGNIEAKTITIDSGYSLIIESGDYVKIAQNTINNGDIYIDNTASYVQINDLAKNLGNGLYKVSIITTSLEDDDRFTYFSSPVKNETLQVFSSWAKMNYIWNFDTAIQDWNILTGTETMLPTVGYAVKPAASNTFPFNAQTIFNGEFNNGVYTTNLIYNIGGLDNDNNLIGNPYPSAIDATMLLNQNPGTNAFYFWTHKSALGSTGYLGDDYAIWNNSGGIASSSGSPAPTGYIANGQGFFVDATATGTITFNNAMRVTGNNTDFRRPSTNENKLWLNLTNTNQYFSQILIAFSENGSDNFDPTYDAVRLNSGSEIRFYTIGSNNEQFAIETFDNLTNEKIVKLGIETLQTGEFIFEIDYVQNFENINIYLKDNLSGNIHNLKNSAYRFVINQIGVTNNRFELLISRNTLLIDSEALENTITIYQNTQEELIIKSNGNATLKNIKIFNLLGKQLINVSKINKNIYRIKSPFNTGITLFITTELSNGEKKHKKFYVKN